VSRLTSEFWVAAYRARLGALNIPVYITARGDATAGAVLVKLCTLDGQACVYHRRLDLMTGGRSWDILIQGAEADCDASIQKQRSFDPDLWVVEIEDRQGRHCLGDEGLSE